MSSASLFSPSGQVVGNLPERPKQLGLQMTMIINISVMMMKMIVIMIIMMIIFIIGVICVSID